MSSLSRLPEDWLERPLAELAQLAPIEPVQWPLAQRQGVEVYIKREDLLDAHLGGNKFYKLYYPLKQARQLGVHHLATWGGAYSNHLFAFAKACQTLGLQGVALVRGDNPDSPSATLQDIAAMGVHIHWVSRRDYARRAEPEFMAALERQLGPRYWIPEGGSGDLGAQGMRDFALGLPHCSWPLVPNPTSKLPVDIIALPTGTGASLAGIVAANLGPQILGVSALKLGDQLAHYQQTIAQQAQALGPDGDNTWQLDGEFHAGGYARYPEYLRDFVEHFEAQTQIPLDPVYGAKLFYAMAHHIQHRWPQGTRVLVIHTGGLQGKRGIISREAAGDRRHPVPNTTTASR